MKKIISLLIIIFLVNNCGIAQIAFYDAAFLRGCLKDNKFNIQNRTNQKSDSLNEIKTSLETELSRLNPVDTVKSKNIQSDLETIDASIEKIDAAKKDTLVAILKRYFPALPQNPSSSDINDLLKVNPYLKNYTVVGSVKSGGAAGSLASGLAHSAGGLNVTKYANAISDLMIERAKEELTIAFFDRFKDFAKKNPEFQILFPETTENLSNLLSYAYPQMLPALRDGFFKDLKQITYNLDDLLDLPRYQSLLKNFPEVKIAIRSLRLFHELETSASNAADVIKEFSSFDEWTSPGNNKIQSVGSCIKIAAFFSESIRSAATEDQRVWISAEELKGLFYDKDLFNIYMGLLYQQAIITPIEYVSSKGTRKQLSDILKDQQNNLFLFQNKLKEFFDLTGNVNTAFKDLRNKIRSDENPTNEDIYNYINTSLDVVDYAFGIVKIFKEEPVATEYLELARASNNLYRDIYTKQYTLAVKDALDILGKLCKVINAQINLDDLQKITAIKEYSGVAKDEVADLIKDISLDKAIKNERLDSVTKAAENHPEIEQLAEHYNLMFLSKFIEKVKPFALFMANVVEAKDEKDIKAALQSVILPVGSSSIKKYTHSNLCVQTYLGAYGSFGGAKKTEDSWSNKFGVIAPIGFSYTPGFSSWGKGGALSLFGSLLDLGAIVDYKLKKEPDVNSTDPDATVIKKDYEIRLGQIFSPGAYLVYGFPCSLPLAIGVGAQYGPGLSKIDSQNTASVNNPSWRGSIFLSVDMPFFTLWNKRK